MGADHNEDNLAAKACQKPGTAKDTEIANVECP